MEQFDHLLLLIGTNPLPNAVVGKLLAGQQTTMSLVYSDRVSTYAGNLKEWLVNQTLPPKRVLKHPKVKESDPASIFDGVCKELDKVEGRRIALAYTGGKKVMAVHAYRAAEKWAENNDAEVEFVYLDADSMCLHFEPLRPEDGASIRREYVGRAVKLELKDMLTLHGWKLMQEPTETPLLTSVALQVAYLFEKKKGKHWINWKNQALNPCKKNDGKWKDEQDLQGITLSFPSQIELQEISDLMRKAFHLAQNIHSFSLGYASKQCGFAQVADLCGWLDGKWLEHRVLDAFTQMSGNLHLNQCLLGVETEDVQFEVDVIAIRGYQMFAFSCTTLWDKGPSRSQLKKRLFEIYVRARQLGGDEARVALVCMAEDPNGLQNEMRRDFDQEGRAKVFGRRHLADLEPYISQWIKEQSKEENTRCNKSYL